MEETVAVKKPKSRILALDILRGITIAGMIMVNNPGSWGAIYAPLEHASWFGLTPTDLVFPFFMFIMGISTYISMRKYDFAYSHATLVKVVRRTIVIFLIGLGIAWFSRLCYGLARADEALPLWDRIVNAANSFSTIRILGVMPRLALCYCAAAIIAISVKHTRIPYIAAGLLVVYGALLLMFNGLEFSLNNIVYVVDHAVLGDAHLYKDTVTTSVGVVDYSSPYSMEMFETRRLPIDPEGLLSTIPAIAHVLIGFCCGRIIVTVKDNNERMQKFFIVGTILMFAGFLFSYGMPVSKKLWTPTFAILTCGLAASFLALLIWIIDVKGYKKWTRFFEAFGINPLFMYVLGGVLGILFNTVPFFGNTLHTWLYNEALVPLFGDRTFASLVYALIFIAINWSIGYILYKKKIYIKI